MLTSEQQKTIENSLWIVNTALKSQGFGENDDLRQDALLYLCNCIQRFDPEKHTQWSTYAYKSVFLYIKRQAAKAAKKNNRVLEGDIFDFVQPLGMPVAEVEYDDRLENIMRECSAFQRSILSLKLQGYTQDQIAMLLKKSKKYICKEWTAIRQKDWEFVK